MEDLEQDLPADLSTDLLDTSLKDKTSIPSALAEEPKISRQGKKEDTEILNLMEFNPNKSGYSSKEKVKPLSPEKENSSQKTQQDFKELVSKNLKTEIKEQNEALENSASENKASELEPPSEPDLQLEQNNIRPAAVPIQPTLQQAKYNQLIEEKVQTLEEEKEKLRKENEHLSNAGDVLRKQLDKSLEEKELMKKTYEEKQEELNRNNNILNNTLQDQKSEMEKLQIKNKELEKRFTGSLKNVRFRERDLENRLEIMKTDNEVILRQKTKTILSLKNQLEHSKTDLDKHKDKYKELKEEHDKRISQSRRVLRGLRQILDILKPSLYQQEEIANPEPPKLQIAGSQEELAENQEPLIQEKQEKKA